MATGYKNHRVLCRNSYARSCGPGSHSTSSHGLRRGLCSAARSARFPHLRPASYKVRASTRSVQKKVAHGVSRGNTAKHSQAREAGVRTPSQGPAPDQLAPTVSSDSPASLQPPHHANSACAGDPAFSRRKKRHLIDKTRGRMTPPAHRREKSLGSGVRWATALPLSADSSAAKHWSCAARNKQRLRERPPELDVLPVFAPRS